MRMIEAGEGRNVVLFNIDLVTNVYINQDNIKFLWVEFDKDNKIMIESTIEQFQETLQQIGR